VQKGIIHNDVKLSNILFTRAHQTCLLVDFGLAGRQTGRNMYAIISYICIIRICMHYLKIYTQCVCVCVIAQMRYSKSRFFVYAIYVSSEFACTTSKYIHNVCVCVLLHKCGIPNHDSLYMLYFINILHINWAGNVCNNIIHV